MIRNLLIATLLTSAAPVAAEVPFLGMPLDCTLGRTCFVEDYVDADPGPDRRDYTCGIKSRDGHRGTDFVLVSHALMNDGVPVLASAPGVVQATRDGIKDQPYTPDMASQIKGRECGNAVRILHENGMQTLYCHMRQGSVAVQKGDLVARGDSLGLVGMSGQSNIPHVHITVLKDGKPLDPFAPKPNTCGAFEDQLWLDTIDYEPTGFVTTGFSTSVPDFDAVRSGAARKSSASGADPLVLYAYFHDAKDGDVLSFQAAGPEGQIFEHSELITTPRKAMYRAFGKRAPATGWAAGDYRGYTRLERKGQILAVRHADILVK